MSYTPPESTQLSNLSTQIRLGIQGWPGSGKTCSALTFPNPIVCDFDNKLGYHRDRTDVHVLPFYSQEFYKEKLKGKNKRDAFISWLRNEALKLQPDNTLIIDSWTMLQAAIDSQIALEPEYTKGGQLNEFSPWARKIDYSAAICELLKGLDCNVVVTFHEMSVRDEKSGQLLDKLLPLMQGKFLCQLQGHFTDWFRQHAIPKIKYKSPGDTVGTIVEIDAPNETNCPGKYKLSNPVEYFWQIQGDDTFDASCGTMRKLQANWKFVPATFESFKKYS
jgi:hypothetical protein